MVLFSKGSNKKEKCNRKKIEDLVWDRTVYRGLKIREEKVEYYIFLLF